MKECMFGCGSGIKYIGKAQGQPEKACLVQLYLFSHGQINAQCLTIVVVASALLDRRDFLLLVGF